MNAWLPPDLRVRAAVAILETDYGVEFTVGPGYLEVCWAEHRLDATGRACLRLVGLHVRASRELVVSRN